MRFFNRIDYRMLTVTDLISIADEYRRIAGIERETTLSYRMFGDTKKLALLRSGGADVTMTRFRAGLDFLLEHWPEAASMPEKLESYAAWKRRNANAETQEAAE